MTHDYLVRSRKQWHDLISDPNGTVIHIGHIAFVNTEREEYYMYGASDLIVDRITTTAPVLIWVPKNSCLVVNGEDVFASSDDDSLGAYFEARIDTSHTAPMYGEYALYDSE